LNALLIAFLFSLLCRGVESALVAYYGTMPFESISSSEQLAQIQCHRSNGNRSLRATNKKKKTKKRKYQTSSTYSKKSVEYEDIDDRRAPDAGIMEPNLEPFLAKVICRW
jgi:hypothetical protein